MPDAPTMRPYMAFAGEPEHGAVLVLARDCRDAKPVAYGLLMALFDVEYTDVRVRKLREHRDWLLSLGNPRHLAAGRAHGLIDVPACDVCALWHGPLDAKGRCAACADLQVTEAA